MTKTVAPSSQIDAGKRVLRTVLFIVLGLASAAPYVIGGLHFSDAQVTAILAQVSGVAVALNAAAVTPWGQKVLSWIGLDAAQVATAQSSGAQTGHDTAKTIADVQPVASAIVERIQAGDIAAAVNAAAAAASSVSADVSAVSSDVQDVVAGAGEVAGIDASGKTAQS